LSIENHDLNLKSAIVNQKLGNQRGLNVDEDQNRSVSETSSQTDAATSNVPVLNGLERIALEDKVIETLRTCYDPEIPVNIYELGLIYEVKVEPRGEVGIRMTLTAPNCPAASYLPLEVEGKVRALPQVTGVKVDVVWEPPWDPSKMSEAARLQLGMF
jgi:FeS assembly SUF system protein